MGLGLGLGLGLRIGLGLGTSLGRWLRGLWLCSLVRDVGKVVQARRPVPLTLFVYRVALLPA